MDLKWGVSLRNSIAGLRHGIRHERPVRQEVAALVAALILAPLLARDGLHGVLLVAAVAATLVIELLNAAIETVCDRITREHDEEVRIAKDYGSAAVTLTILVGLAVWFEAVWHVVLR